MPRCHVLFSDWEVFIYLASYLKDAIFSTKNHELKSVPILEIKRLLEFWSQTKSLKLIDRSQMKQFSIKVLEIKLPYPLSPSLQHLPGWSYDVTQSVPVWLSLSFTNIRDDRLGLREPKSNRANNIYTRNLVENKAYFLGFGLCFVLGQQNFNFQCPSPPHRGVNPENEWVLGTE